jgi:hypothetical protein
MRYTLVTSTFGPGLANAAMSAAAAGANAGLEGYWQTEIGVLNQTVELWSGPRPAPSGEGPLDQDSWTLTGIVGPKAPDAPGGIYELRHYRMRPGLVPAWLAIYTAALPAREKFSRIVGLFASEAGEPDRVVHIWGYPDLNTRASARAAALQDPAWTAFLRESRAQKMVVRQEVSILLPAGHSPLK